MMNFRIYIYAYKLWTKIFIHICIYRINRYIKYENIFYLYINVHADIYIYVKTEIFFFRLFYVEQNKKGFSHEIYLSVGLLVPRQSKGAGVNKPEDLYIYLIAKDIPIHRAISNC